MHDALHNVVLAPFGSVALARSTAPYTSNGNGNSCCLPRYLWYFLYESFLFQSPLSFWFVDHFLRWSRSSNSKNGGGTKQEDENETTFRARFDLENAEGGAAFVVAATSVDQAWGAQVEKGWPDVGPQVGYGYGCDNATK